VAVPLAAKAASAASVSLTSSLSGALRSMTMTSYEAALRELVDQKTYPRVHRLAWSAGHGHCSSLSHCLTGGHAGRQNGVSPRFAGFVLSGQITHVARMTPFD
jgi:hypothetical protein